MGDQGTKGDFHVGRNFAQMAMRPPEAIFSSFETPERSGYDNVVDLSALTARPTETLPCGQAWVELPRSARTEGSPGCFAGAWSWTFRKAAPAHDRA